MVDFFDAAVSVTTFANSDYLDGHNAKFNLEFSKRMPTLVVYLWISWLNGEGQIGSLGCQLQGGGNHARGRGRSRGVSWMDSRLVQ